MSAGARPLLSIVVPVLNEAENLEEFHRRLSTAVAALDRDVEVVFVDDGSTDDTFALLVRLRDRDPRVIVLRLSRNFGSHNACLAGFAHARGDHAVILSADLQDPPELIGELVAAADRGHDVVLGTRETRDDPPATVLFASLFHRLMRRIALPNWPEGGFDFMLVSRRVLAILLARTERNTSIFGEMLWSGFSQTSVPYRRGGRRAGASKWTPAKKLKLAIDACVSFSYVPIRLMSAVGVACAALGALYAVLVVVLRLTYGNPITGWTSLMVVLLIVGGVQMVMLGVIGEYTWRVLDEMRARPPFIVAEAIGLDERAPPQARAITSSAPKK